MKKWNVTDADLEKQFRCNGLSIAREDYESMPCPLCTENLDDTTMQNIIDDVYEALSNQWRFTDEEIKEFVEHPCCFDLPSGIEDAFWEEVETTAIHYGAVYYEDME